MNISGTFKTLDNEHLVRVEIQSPYVGNNIEIGDNNLSDVCFGYNPVIIKTNTDNTFNHIITRQCTINLVSSIWLGDILFANNTTSIPVNIYYDNVCIFDGFVKHNTYSQGYDSNYNEIQINCVDYLGALEQQKMTDLTDYETLKNNRNQRTVKELFQTMLGNNVNIYYDGSKQVYDDHHSLSVYWTDYLSILDNAWLGEDEDDVWSNDEIIEAILKYMNLHIIQLQDHYQITNKRAYYIFDWDYTQRFSTDEGTYYRFMYNLNTGASIGSNNTLPINLKSLTLQDFTSDDTNFSIDNVYNRISIKEKANGLNNIISNPLDTNDLESPYLQYNRYMTEFVGIGAGRESKRRLTSLVKGTRNWLWNDNECFFRHWYIRYLHNQNWAFKTYQFDVNSASPNTGMTNIRSTTRLIKDQDLQGGDLTLYNTADSILHVVDQWSLLKAAWYRGGKTATLPNGQTGWQSGAMIPANNNDTQYHNLLDAIRQPNCIGATMFNLWSTGKITPKDNSTPTKKANNNNWICITVGNRYSDSVQESLFAQNDGVCKYVTTSAANLVPADDNVQYHLVFSGKIILSPFINRIWDYYKTKNNQAPIDSHDDVGIASNFKYGNEKGCNYVRVFYDLTANQASWGDEYNQTYWKEPPTGFNQYSGNIAPWISDDGLKRYEYQDVVDGDTIYKVGVLLCRLKIGNKYLSEGYTTEIKNNVEYSYPNNTFTWTTDSTATFTIGFDPKIGDFLIGQEYKIGTDISTFTNIDTDYGVDIPISKSDKLHGQVEFTIIGPCPIGWANNNHRHHTFFRHSKNWTDLINVFYNNANIPVYTTEAQGYTQEEYNVKFYSYAVDNIYIGDLKCKLYSDNGGNSFLKENDIIYMSDESSTYVEKKDNIEFKLISGFTADELAQFGTTIGSVDNNIFDVDDAPNLALYPMITYTDDDGTITKPEKLYVKQYYDEYKQPKLLLDTEIKYTDEQMFFRRYNMNFFNGKIFYPLDIDTDLKYQTSKITMKER